MNSKNRFSVIASVLASALFLAAVLLADLGCNPHKGDLRPENLFKRIGGQGGQTIEPKKCMLRVAILNRPFRDAAINEVVWRAADEQSITPEARRELEINGLRIGRITGELPPELEAVVNAPPPHKVEPATFLLDDSEQTLVSVNEAVDGISLLLNRENRVYGKDYQAASGYFRATVHQEGGTGVSLRLVPEIHHGPIQRSYQAISTVPAYAPQQFRIQDGQQEETLHDMAANLVLEPGQVAVIGCRPDQERSLGSFLFTQSEAHGDQRRQKLILIWASRNMVGQIEDKPRTSDRPTPSDDLGPRAEAVAKPSPATARNGETRPRPKP